MQHASFSRVAAMAVLLVGCKRVATVNVDAGPPAEVAPAGSVPMPASTHPAFAVNDAVAVVKEDGSFEVDGIVNEVGGPIVFVEANAWLTVAEVTSSGAKLAGTERKAERGYKIRVGTGRVARAVWFPAAQVFPVPWMAGTVNAGDTFLQRRTGNFPSPRCTVKTAPYGPHLGVTATCPGSDEPVQVERDEMFAVLRAPRAGEPKPGDVVYVGNAKFALVKGDEGERVVVRETGYNATDKSVLRSAIQLLR